MHTARLYLRFSHARLSSISLSDYLLPTLPVPDLPASSNPQRSSQPSVPDHESCRRNSWFPSAHPCSCLAIPVYNIASRVPDHPPVPDHPSACSFTVPLPSWLPTRFWTRYHRPRQRLTPLPCRYCWPHMCVWVLPPCHTHLLPDPVQDPWIPQACVPVSPAFGLHYPVVLVLPCTMQNTKFKMSFQTSLVVVLQLGPKPNHYSKRKTYNIHAYILYYMVTLTTSNMFALLLFASQMYVVVFFLQYSWCEILDTVTLSGVQSVHRTENNDSNVHNQM